MGSLRATGCAAVLLGVGVRAAEQVHLSLGKNGSMTVQWASDSAFGAVSFGVFGSGVTREVASAGSARYEFHGYVSPDLHTASLDGLVPGETYEYRLDGSFPYRFTAPQADGSARAYPASFALVGDIGAYPVSGTTVESVGLADVDAFLVVGDLSYDNGVGPIWDDWANLVEPVACATPMMVLPGNHEVEREPDTGTAFRQYRARFAAPEAARERVGYGYWGSDWDARFTYEFGASYYAWTLGRVKWVFLNSYVAAGERSAQYQWLDRELACVDRSATPWVFAAMHAPWYSTNPHHQGETATLRHRQHLEGLLAAGGVTATFAGHVHAYERSAPACFGEARPDGVTHVTVGLTGQWYVNTFDEVEWDRAWSAATDDARHGFGKLTVFNDTLAEWRFVPNDGTRGDAVYLSNTAPAACGLDPPARPDDCAADAADAVDARIANVPGDDDPFVLRPTARPTYPTEGVVVSAAGATAPGLAALLAAAAAAAVALR